MVLLSIYSTVPLLVMVILALVRPESDPSASTALERGDNRQLASATRGETTICDSLDNVEALNDLSEDDVLALRG